MFPQVAHLPAAPHPGSDHLPASLPRSCQAVSLAADYVSLTCPGKLSYLQRIELFLFTMETGNLFHCCVGLFFFLVSFSYPTQVEGKTKTKEAVAGFMREEVGWEISRLSKSEP